MNDFDSVTFPLFVIDSDEDWDVAWNSKKDFEIHRISTENCDLAMAMNSCVEKATEADEDFFILCDKTAFLSEEYKKSLLIEHIILAHKYGVDLLCSGIGNFDCAVPIDESLYWISNFSLANFVIIFKKFYSSVSSLEEVNSIDSLSTLIANKMLIYPFIVNHVIIEQETSKESIIQRRLIEQSYLNTELKLATYKRAFLRFR